MFDIFQTYILEKIKGQSTLSDAEFELIKSVFVPKKFRKKQYLLQDGEIWKHHTFVCKGCFRMYRADDKGMEHILQFAVENWWTGDRESIISGKPSKYNIEALEDSEVLLIAQTEMEMLAKKIPAMGALIRNLQQNNVIATQNRIHAAISYTAEEKYLDFIKTYPDMLQRVSQHMIASYLGITRETLSRVRRQSMHK